MVLHDGGLSRFDGYSFTNYGPQRGLPPRAVNDLLETRAGEYWVATNGGLARFDPTSVGQKFRVFLADDGEDSNRINTLAEDHMGGLWCGTNRGVYRFERTGGRFRAVNVVGPNNSGEPAPANALLEDRRGALWIGAENGLYRLLPNGMSDHFTRANGLPSSEIRALLEDHEGRLWVGAFEGEGLFQMTPDRARRHPTVERVFTIAAGLRSGRIISLFESKAGKLWIGAFGGLSELWPEPARGSRALTTYTLANGLSGQEAFSIAEDRSHDLWIGSAEGAMKITQSNFLAYTASDGLTPEEHGSSPVKISSIFQDRSGAPCITTAGDGRKPFLSRLEGQHFKFIFPNLPVTVTDIGWGTHQVALQDHTGDWWIATAKGLARFASPARFDQLAQAPVKAFYTTIDGLPTDRVFRVFEDSRGDIWVATEPHGLTRWDRRTASFLQDGDDRDPTSDLISAFAEDRAGDVWIGTFGDDMVRFRNGTFARFGEQDGLGAGGVRDIHSDRAGRVWIGTSHGGVTRVDSPETDRPRFTNISVSQGLASTQAQCITEDRWGRIYVGGGRGIDRLDTTALNGAQRIKHFTTADGLASGKLEAAFADKEGNLWFGTTLGLSRLVPEPDAEQPPPRTLISGLRVRGVPYPLSDLGVEHLSGLQLKSDQTQIEVSFLSLSFEAGEVLRYQYMLADADRDWSPLTTERTVNFANLKPGSYRFLVRAVNSSGIGGAAPASIEFMILPPVWQRWWFLALCACAAVSALFALHLSRVGRLVQLERLRTRIATDLHDDIGATLSQIAVVTEVLSQRGGEHNQFHEPLRQIANDSRELVSSMSDLVWSIDPRRDHLDDLAQRMRRFASDMFTARDIHFRFSAPAGELRLTVDQRRNIFLICKESVNNIVRHSDCTEAEVALTLEAGTLGLRIQDNGRGLGPLPSGNGNGLPSLRARAGALGGKVEITSGDDCGTAVTLTVPLTRPPKPRWQPVFHLNRW